MFNYFKQSFIPGDSWFAQLLSVTDEILKSFDCNPPTDMRGIFLDISKAFNKVCHESLILNLKTYGVYGILSKTTHHRYLISCWSERFRFHHRFYIDTSLL